ncbi:hypothetical protein AGMMS49921_11320 [Endomicrobiia bacterium]|nr:hypothetical protein AGMMS49921_11320 [Endomicrobiia bacterium]
MLGIVYKPLSVDIIKYWLYVAVDVTNILVLLKAAVVSSSNEQNYSFDRDDFPSKRISRSFCDLSGLRVYMLFVTLKYYQYHTSFNT